MRHNYPCLFFSFVVCIALSLNITASSSSQVVDSWADIEVLSFNGENISFKLTISTLGNHVKDIIWLRIEPPYISTSDGHGISDTLYAEIWRSISDVVFNEGLNITVFSYAYAYNHTYYKAEPKAGGYLLFPWDEHRLVLYMVPSFNLTMDENPLVCGVPSQNYEGIFQATFAPTSTQPSMYSLKLTVKHSVSFTTGAFLILLSTVVSLYLPSFSSVAVIILIALKRKSHDLILNLVHVSSAIIFFVPAFQIAFYSLKSPLPLVFWDVLLIPVIPLNALIIICALLLKFKEKQNH